MGRTAELTKGRASGAVGGACNVSYKGGRRRGRDYPDLHKKVGSYACCVLPS